MTTPSDADAPRPTGWLSRVADYAQLTRPRIAVMVVVVVGVSGYVGTRANPDLRLLAQTMLGTFLVAASASACAQLLERRLDRLMPRTANRPLPTCRLGAAQASLFVVLTACGGLAYLAWAANWLTVFWAAATWGAYVGVYTPLKTRSPLNTLVGAVVGALPVLIGWSAVGGEWDVRVDPRWAALFLILFYWQFPHFMAIAWIYREQYERADMRMVSVLDPTGRTAGRYAVQGALAVLLFSGVPLGMLEGAAGPSYGYASVAAVLGLAQLWFAVRFYRHRTERAARWLLRATVIYLPALLIVLAVATQLAR
jgi:protoheme IX farnesyltransferase